MSWNARRAAIVLLALIGAVSAVWVEQGYAQKGRIAVRQPVPLPQPVPPPTVPPDGGGANLNPDGFLNNGIHLKKDEKHRGDQIQAAIDYINDEDWKVAIPSLQKLLQIDEDVFVRLKRKNDAGSEIYVWVSAKQEADRLIGSLPRDGKDFYEVSFGATAADLLKKARTSGDPNLLSEIVKKYGHTKAGTEAIKLLADYKCDRGEYMPALLCYSKLINRLGEEQVPPIILAKAAWAAHLAPPSSSGQNAVTASNVPSEKELWKMLRNRTREVKFGEQDILVEDLENHVARLDRSSFEPNATDSLIYRASLNRNNQLTGGPAYVTRREWGVPLLKTGLGGDGYDSARQHILQARNALKTRNQPIIPAFAPIALTATTLKGEKKPLLIYKNFWGVMALDVRTGAPAWYSPSSYSLQRVLGGSKSGLQNAFAQWLNFYQGQAGQPQVLFENSTVGTLSTDGRFVYVVDDLAIPPLPHQQVNNGMFIQPGVPAMQLDKETEDAVSHNRLHALSLARSGALTWELGGGGGDEKDLRDKDPLRDHYFLGPPLPLAGKLYVLADKQQEIRLICLENIDMPPGANGQIHTVPRVVSTQTLGMTQDRLQNDPLRRTWAAHLAYGEGILVCPTNTGAVFGVNLLENSLVWAYPYRDKSDAPPQPQINGGFRRGMPMPGMGMPHVTQQNLWKVTAPVISDGKVVFAAPDARSVHCINLRDGSPVWHRPKLDDDLYLGNVYNGKVLIVGKKNVRALSLNTGETVWSVETGIPSGQGIGSDNVYYLPLAEAAEGKQPQIVGIDMDQGSIVKRSMVRASAADRNTTEVPGNLLFAEGKVISVTAFGKDEGEVVAYPQIKVRLAEMDDEIAKNPNDARALTERGELRLDKGDLAGAIDDLSTALKNKPDAPLRAKARGKLYETLTVYIRDHFNDAEKYLKEYEDLCKIDLDAAPESERAKLEVEQRRRRSTYLWLVGKGREKQGRLVEAFDRYQEFAAEAGKQSELVPSVDDPQVKAAPDVWSRGRIIAMMNNAKPEHRQPLEKMIADRWSKLRETSDLKELRSFVRMFGSVSDAGKEARLELVERLMEQKDSGEEHPLLEAELELNQFRTGQSSPQLAGRATEALARLYTRKGLLEDAAYCYRKLNKEYAGLILRDGKTGRQIYDDDAATDKRLIPYLDDAQPLESIKRFKAARKDGDNPMPLDGDLFQFEHSGEALPFFRHHIVGLNMKESAFTLLDRNLEDDKQRPKIMWSAPLAPTAFRMLSMSVLSQNHQVMNPGMPGVIMPPNPTHPQARFPYSTVGHLIVLPVAHRVFGIDPVNHRVLWEKDLSKGAGPQKSDVSQPNSPVGHMPPAVDPRDGSMLLLYNGGWAQRLGQVGPFLGQTVCVQSVDRLSALDPITGRELWSRTDVNSRNYLFSDEEYVFVVELDNNNNPNASRIFRATDGSKVKAPDFGALFARRLQVLGRYLLLSETSPTNEVVVRLYDVVTGQDAWKQSYAARSLVARGEEAWFTGIIEPDGKVHVIDLRARKEVMAGELSDAVEVLRNVQAFHLLADRKNFYFVPQMAPNAPGQAGMVFSSVMTHLGMRTVPIQGNLCAFERGTGNLLYYANIKEPKFLILDQFQDLPLIFLTARTQTMANMGRRGMGGGQSSVTLTSVGKVTGKRVFDETFTGNQAPSFFGIRVDPRARTLDLLGQQVKVSFSPAPPKQEKSEPAAAAPPSPPAPADAAVPQNEIRVNRGVLDRARIREIAPPPPG